MTAAPITSAERFSPFGPLGMVIGQCLAVNFARGEGRMWILVVLNLFTGAFITIPGYSTSESCAQGGREVTAAMKGLSKQMQVSFICTNPK
jgi:hypothetical protein